MNTPRQKTNQQGFTLVMSLVILVILTILSLSSMQSTRLETAMAGNMRESDLAFQAAEMGLDAGENHTETVATSKTDYNDLNGLYSETTDDPDYFDDNTWNIAQTASTSLSSLYTQPRFIIKYLGDRSQNEVAKVNIGGYGSAQPGITVSNFRITARGVGQTNSAFRMVQSYYGKEF
jgi:type IV pilus assembly protein PilX